MRCVIFAVLFGIGVMPQGTLVFLEAQDMHHKYATDYQWSRSPTTDLSKEGQHLIDLNSCAPGVTSGQEEYWIYISDGKASEATKTGAITIASIDGDGKNATVVTSAAHGLSSGQRVRILAVGGGFLDAYATPSATVTVVNATTFRYPSPVVHAHSTGGKIVGTCEGDNRPGTLSLTTKKSHAAGYVVGSASGGLQEASIAAAVPMSNPTSGPQNGVVVVPPGTELKIYASVFIRASAQVVDLSGSVFECYVIDSCIVIGNRENSLLTSGVTLINPRGRPMVAEGNYAMIEVNATKTRIFNVETRSSPFGKFGHLVQVDDDQAFLLDGIDSAVGDEVRCDAVFCGSAVYAPGPFGRGNGRNANAAVGYIRDGNLSMNGSGNCIDWQSGNTLRVEDTVCQGFSQFGIRGGIARGGYGGIELDNVYMEEFQSNNANPLGNIGQAGVIMQGGRLTIHSDRTPQGSQGRAFTDVGSTYYHYWIVASHSTLGDSLPLPLGWAKTDERTPIPVVFPRINGVSGSGRYMVLRMSWNGKGAKPVPSGTGNWLVGTVDPATCTSICRFTDQQFAPTPFTTKNQVSGAVYHPLLSLWPGNIVLGSGSDTTTAGSGATLVADLAPGGIVSTAPFIEGPFIYATKLGDLGILGPEAYPNYATPDPGDRGSPTYMLKNGLILQSKANNGDAGQFTNYKGRVNFLLLGSGPSPLITWEDSNPAKTVVDRRRRPAADVEDADTGMDSSGVLYSRANKEIRNYIGTLPDGKSWKEQLTGSQKTFAVPVVLTEASSLTVGNGSVLSQIKIYKLSNVRKATIPAQTCIDLSEKATGLGSSDQIAGITPPTSLGDLSLNAYPKETDLVTLHFCNPSRASVPIPEGPYSFLAVR